MTAVAAPPDARAPPLDASRYGQFVLVGTLAAGYVVVSTGLISYNKFLIQWERFPFAVPLVFLHSIFCSVLSLVTYLVRPDLFPALSDPSRRVPLDRDLFVKGAMPIGFIFSAQLALSNSAYLHSSVAFLQMMKEANLALVYTLSLAAALERFQWRSAGLLLAVVAATFLTIQGEINFSFTGFALQGVSQLFECTKIVLQAMLLSAAGRKLDALTYVLLIMPFCAVFLGAALGGIYMWSPHSAILLPTMVHLQEWWPHLLANSCIAFLLNVVVALFVKHSSAVAFILCGMVKDAMIVLSGVLILSEVISRSQAVGFAMQLWFIMVYSLVKTFPAEFEDGLSSGFFKLFIGSALTSGDLQKAVHVRGESSAPLSCTVAKDYGALAEAGALEAEASACGSHSGSK